MPASLACPAGYDAALWDASVKKRVPARARRGKKKRGRLSQEQLEAIQEEYEAQRQAIVSALLALKPATAAKGIASHSSQPLAPGPSC
jgi:hypothetical protein